MKQAHDLAGKQPTPHDPTRPWTATDIATIVPADTSDLERAIRLAPERMWERYTRVDRRTGRRTLKGVFRQGQQRGRANGMISDNAVFGWSPPLPARQREHCIGCRPNLIAPGVMDALAVVARQADASMREHQPEAWQHLQETGAEIGPDWRFPGTGWTSCIINETAQLPYHVDGGNTAGTWSAMVVIRRFVTGGHLHLPDHGLTVPCDHGTTILFCGQQHLHGVTPFSRTRHDGYRWTCVFYQRTGMRGCGTPAEELAKAKAKRTEREHKLAQAEVDA